MVTWSGDAHPTPTPSPGRCHAVVDDLLDERRGTVRRNEQGRPTKSKSRLVVELLGPRRDVTAPVPLRPMHPADVSVDVHVEQISEHSSGEIESQRDASGAADCRDLDRRSVRLRRASPPAAAAHIHGTGPPRRRRAPAGLRAEVHGCFSRVFTRTLSPRHLPCSVNLVAHLSSFVQLRERAPKALSRTEIGPLSGPLRSRDQSAGQGLQVQMIEP